MKFQGIYKTMHIFITKMQGVHNISVDQNTLSHMKTDAYVISKKISYTGTDHHDFNFRVPVPSHHMHKKIMDIYRK